MKYSFLFIAILVFLWGCTAAPHTQNPKSSQLLKAAGKTADFPQMTQDHNGTIVAWWIETDQDTGAKFVYFSKSSGSHLSFEESRRIPASRNINAGSERLPKLVIKPDGTYILVFARSNQESDAPFAGSVLYSQSFDAGSTWTEPKIVHSDTNPDNSHGFPEAILLPDGEVGAVWLDGRHHQEQSALYFAKTNGRQGFGKDKIIGGPACQCCKLDMHVDDSQTLHMVYRGLTQNNIRDIMHIASDNNGNSFSDPYRISNDNWQIRACPHNGPSITRAGNGLNVIWYTQGGGEGLYYASYGDDGQTFSARKQLAARANQPYIASLGHTVMAIWSEVYQDNEETYRRVKMSMISDGKKSYSRYLSPTNVEASMPYLLEMKNGDVIATWTQKFEDGNELYFQRFSGNRTQ